MLLHKSIETLKLIIQFEGEMCEAFEAVMHKGQELWMDRIFTLCPLSIDMWPKSRTCK